MEPNIQMQHAFVILGALFVTIQRAEATSN